MFHREKGFTLIELLIVVAIIGIIAAIAVPNLLTAIQRSKRSRTVADMRAIGTALGSYNVDTNIFPLFTTLTSFGDETVTNGVAFQANSDSGFADGMPLSYYEGSSRDGWSSDFMYVVDEDDSGQGYTLLSYGKDRQPKPTDASEFDSDIIYINGQFKAPASVKGK